MSKLTFYGHVNKGYDEDDLKCIIFDGKDQSYLLPSNRETIFRQYLFEYRSFQELYNDWKRRSNLLMTYYE